MLAMLHIHFVISVVTCGPFPGILDPDLLSRSRPIGCLSTWLYSQFPNDSLVQSEASESEHEEHVCFYPVCFDVIEYSQLLTTAGGICSYTCGW